MDGGRSAACAEWETELEEECERVREEFAQRTSCEEVMEQM